MAQKVKISKASSQMTNASIQNPPAWRMDPAICSIITQFDPESKMGIKISLVILDYDRKCAQAKIEMIDKLKKLLTPPKKNKLLR